MMNKKNIINIIEIILGCLLCSIAVNWIAEPNGLVVTGTTGLSQAIGQIFSVNFRIIYYVLTIIVVLLTLIILGKIEVMKIILVSIIYPNVLYLLGFINVSILFQDKITAIILFGFLYGLGTGLVYRVGSSFGGTDTLGKILKNTIFEHIQLKKIFLMLDCAILLFMTTVFSLELVIYALIAQIIYVNVLNKVNFFDRKSFYDVEIIGDVNSAELISLEKFILDELHRNCDISNVSNVFNVSNVSNENIGDDEKQLDCSVSKIKTVLTMNECVKIQNYLKNNEIAEDKIVMKFIPIKAIFGQEKNYLSIIDDFDV